MFVFVFVFVLVPTPTLPSVDVSMLVLVSIGECEKSSTSAHHTCTRIGRDIVPPQGPGQVENVDPVLLWLSETNRGVDRKRYEYSPIALLSS